MRPALAAVLLAGGAMLLSGCGSAGGDTPSAESGETAATPAKPAVPTEVPDPPTATIDFAVDGDDRSVSADFSTMSCSAHTFAAQAEDGRSASALLPASDSETPGRITVSVMGDDELVVFSGTGLPEFTDLGSAVVASLSDLSGSATVVSIASGKAPAIGEVDLSQGTEVEATLSAALACQK
ncbi:hypothetical protein [Leucobacter sp. USHLN153]|uniref:hypothetical protein n=1 Tax=Leucobacter sp. USHLN153 TaxID=3081268 RepID=UPI0030196D49